METCYCFIALFNVANERRNLYASPNIIVIKSRVEDGWGM